VGLIAELIADILTWFLDIKHWFKKRKRRKFEKDNNLPKKGMPYPSDKIEIVSTVAGIIILFSLFFYFLPNSEIKKTKEKLSEITQILEKEKQVLGSYPNELSVIIRNNPLRMNLVTDSWRNSLQYKLSVDGETYTLFSIGKDGIANTKDDIHLNN
jgi:hypothetical protein